jgi:hypothetical protein
MGPAFSTERLLVEGASGDVATLRSAGEEKYPEWMRRDPLPESRLPVGNPGFVGGGEEK